MIHLERDFLGLRVSRQQTPAPVGDLVYHTHRNPVAGVYGVVFGAGEDVGRDADEAACPRAQVRGDVEPHGAEFGGGGGVV